MKLAIIFLAISFSNCQEEMQSSKITKITYGTSFGMCMGYCTQALTVSEGLAIKTLSARGDGLITKKCTQPFDGFTSLTSKVGLEDFLKLEETIGCPDCADGGAEWIEIFTPKGSKKIVFEYGNEPGEVANFIEPLRSQYDQLGSCE